MRTRKKTQRDDYLKKVGQKIRQARKARGMSQESLALASDLDRSYVGGVERGERNVAVLNLRKIAASLGLKLSELLADL